MAPFPSVPELVSGLLLRTLAMPSYKAFVSQENMRCRYAHHSSRVDQLPLSTYVCPNPQAGKQMLFQCLLVSCDAESYDVVVKGIIERCGLATVAEALQLPHNEDGQDTRTVVARGLPVKLDVNLNMPLDEGSGSGGSGGPVGRNKETQVVGATSGDLETVRSSVKMNIHINYAVDAEHALGATSTLIDDTLVLGDCPAERNADSANDMRPVLTIVETTTVCLPPTQHSATSTPSISTTGTENDDGNGWSNPELGTGDGSSSSQISHCTSGENIPDSVVRSVYIVGESRPLASAPPPPSLDGPAIEPRSYAFLDAKMVATAVERPAACFTATLTVTVTASAQQASAAASGYEISSNGAVSVQTGNGAASLQTGSGTGGASAYGASLGSGTGAATPGSGTAVTAPRPSVSSSPSSPGSRGPAPPSQVPISPAARRRSSFLGIVLTAFALILL